MAKINLTDVSAGYLSLNTYNANNTLIEAAFENTISRDGTSPNAMSANLDMNSFRITNLVTAVNNSEPVTLGQANTLAGVTNPLTQNSVSAVLYPRTAAEISASVTPVNFYYVPGNVLRYGTNTNPGTTDMTTVIQAAINSTHDVLVPAGTYKIIIALVADNAGQRIIGEGKAVSIIKQTIVNKHGISITANDVYIGHLQVKDITRDDGNEYAGILWGAVNGTVIEHVRIDTSDDSGIRCGYSSGGDPGTPSTNSKILYCDVTNVTGGSGIEVIGAEDVLVHGCDIEGTDQHGIRIVGSKRCKASDNNIEHFAESGGGDGIVISGGTVPGPIITDAIQIIVTGNVIRLNTSISQTGGRDGIFVGEDGIDVMISNNFIDMTDSNGDTNVNGILIRDVTAATEGTNKCVITGNIIRGDMEHGIELLNTSSDVKITDNFIEGFNDFGIIITTVTDAVVSGNTLAGKTNSIGIGSLTSLTDAIFTGNTIRNCERGFNIGGVCLRTIISNNNISDVVKTGGSAYGIRVAGTNVDDLIISNNIISNLTGVNGDTIQGITIATNGATDTVFIHDNHFIYASATSQFFVTVTQGLADVRYARKVIALDNNATPTVAGAHVVKTGGTTTITDFDDGVIGQELVVLALHAVTITDGSPIVLSGSTNFVMASGDTLTLRMILDQVWTEVSRGDN